MEDEASKSTVEVVGQRGRSAASTSTSTSPPYAAGGGGSGFIGAAGVANAFTLAGGAGGPPATTDADYVAGVGIGGAGAVAGGAGLVTIRVE